jgi:hypothetical protein
MKLIAETDTTPFINRVLITEGYLDTYYGDIVRRIDKDDKLDFDFEKRFGHKRYQYKVRVLINDEYGDYQTEKHFNHYTEATQYCESMGFTKVYYN